MHFMGFEEDGMNNAMYWDRKAQQKKEKTGKKKKPVVRIILLCILAALVLAFLGIIIWYFAFYPFCLERIDNVALGASEAQVESVLGKADKESDFVWEYYDDRYLQLEEEIENKTLELLQAETAEEVETRTEELALLTEEFFGLQYKYVCITFNGNGQVEEVLFDARRCEETLLAQKWGKEAAPLKAPAFADHWESFIGLFRNKEERIVVQDVPAFSDLSKTRAEAQVYYADGSYKRVYLSAEAVGNVKTYRAGTNSVTWQDGWGEYTGVLTVLEKIERGTEIEGTLEGGATYRLTALAAGTLSELPAFSLELGGEGSVSGEFIWDTYSLAPAVTHLQIGAGIGSIDRGAFSGFRNFQSAGVQSDAFVFENGVLYDAARTRLLAASSAVGERFSIPDSVTETDGYAFASAKNLRSVETGAGLKALGAFAFADNITLEEVRFSSALETIGEGAFSGCAALRGIVLPDTVTVLAKNTFRGCTALENVQLPAGLLTIEEGVFCDCAALKELYIPAAVQEIDPLAFADRIGDVITGLPYSVGLVTAALSSDEPLCESGLESVTVSGENRYYSSEDGVLFNKDKTELVLFPRKKDADEYTVPDTVYRIGTAAFYGCDQLHTIRLPENLTIIYDHAFAFCGFSEIELPSLTAYIGGYAFAYCMELRSIVIPAGVCHMGNRVFFSNLVQERGEFIGFEPSSQLTDIFLEASEKPQRYRTVSISPTETRQISAFWSELVYEESWSYGAGADVHWRGEWEYIDGTPTVKKTD